MLNTYRKKAIWFRSCIEDYMVAYELYVHDELRGYEFIGILPERRKNPERITKESVLKWGRMVLGDADERNIIFKQITIDNTGQTFEVKMPFDD